MNYLVKVDRHGLIRKTQTVRYYSCVARRINLPGVDIFYSGALHAPEEVRNRRLILNGGVSFGPFTEAINPENTLVYIGVNGSELQEGLSYDNHQQAIKIADLCSEFLKYKVDPYRISIIAAYRPM
jgi:hypothetical protein